MIVKLKTVSIFGTALVLLGAWSWWGHHGDKGAPTSSVRSSEPTSRAPGRPPMPSSLGSPATQAEPRRAARDARDNLRNTTDYAQYASSMREAAERGDPDAQYDLSEALRYCHEKLSQYFLVPGKRARTLDEAQARWATRTPSYQVERRRQEIAEIYSHCHTFLEDSNSGAQMAEWTSWLDRASVNGYPLAQAEKASLLRNATLISELSTDPSVRPDAEAKTKEQELALSALRSEDPEVLWMMSGLVDERRLPQENVGTIPGAWQLLACNRGYDCSAGAEWLQKACSLTTTCVPGESGLEYLKNSLGANFEQAQSTAQDIDARIRAKDWNSLPQYLWATEPH